MDELDKSAITRNSEKQKFNVLTHRTDVKIHRHDRAIVEKFLVERAGGVRSHETVFDAMKRYEEKYGLGWHSRFHLP